MAYPLDDYTMISTFCFVPSTPHLTHCLQVYMCVCVFCLFANVLVSTCEYVHVCVCECALHHKSKNFPSALSCHRVNKTILFSLTKRLNIINSHIFFSYTKIMLNRRNRDKICNVFMYALFLLRSKPAMLNFTFVLHFNAYQNYIIYYCLAVS